MDPGTQTIISFSILLAFSSYFPRLDSSYIRVLTFSFSLQMGYTGKEEASNAGLCHPSLGSQAERDISLLGHRLAWISCPLLELILDTTVIGALGLGKPVSCATNVAKKGKDTMTYSPTRIISIGEGRRWFLHRQESLSAPDVHIFGMV